jgi:hypothetical protein
MTSGLPPSTDIVRPVLLDHDRARNVIICCIRRAFHAAIASKYASGLYAITIKSALAAPVGFLRFCSQPSKVRVETPRMPANVL